MRMSFGQDYPRAPPKGETPSFRFQSLPAICHKLLFDSERAEICASQPALAKSEYRSTALRAAHAQMRTTIEQPAARLLLPICSQLPSIPSENW